MTGPAMMRAKESWGTPPAWVLALAEECDARKSQAKVARRIGYSPTTVNQVISRTYKGDLAAVEAAVRGAFLGERVDCPVLGPLPRDRCLNHQRQPLIATNPERVRLYRACRNGCPHSRLGGDDAQ